MTYLSVCAGIEAATVAWHPLGWEAVAFSEIEPFCCAVLAHHWPAVPNLGDMTAYKEWPLERGTVDLLVGGTPCQSFSVAGLRAGLDDPRGSLMLVYLAIARALAPRWVVWENVPGVLSSNRGRDFGTFLGGLAEFGYGFAYRVLDAQWFGVPQRRRRVFVVGYLGDWRAAAAVLFERESLRGYPAPSREAGERVAPAATRRVGRSGENDFNTGGGLVETAYAVNAHGGSGRMDGEPETFVAAPLCASGRGTERAGESRGQDTLIAQPLRAGRQYSDMGDGSANVVARALRADGFDASEDGTGRGTPLVAQPLRRNGYNNSDPGMEAKMHIQHGAGVRRLTVRECERLMGFPDDFTLIQYPPNPRRVKWAADGPRYRALGNSMAVPCMRWLGERIQAVEEALP